MLEAFPNLGLPKQTFYWTKSLAKSLGRLLVKRVRRDSTVVASEYDGGHWAKLLNEAPWQNFNKAKDYLAGVDSSALVCRIGNQYKKVTKQDYYRDRIYALSEFIAPYILDTRRVVELGCGTGYNLLSLATSDPELQLEGYDLSPNGIAAARQLFKHFDCSPGIVLDQIDLTLASHPNFPAIHNKAVFTFFCLEQIPYSIDKVVENILRQRPLRVVHVEPGVDLLRAGNPMDWPNWLYVRSVDYQTQLFRCIERLESAGQLKVIERRRLPFSPTIQNDGMCIIWEPI